MPVNVNLHGDLSICFAYNYIVYLLCALSEGNKILIYNSFIECYFNYLSVIWHFCSETNSLKLEKLQMKALKLMAANFDASYSTILLTYNKDSLFTVRIRMYGNGL